MSGSTEKQDGIWFIYDGECPICQYAAHALRIKQQFGELHLLDARTQQDHPLVRAVTERGLDLDDGMMIIRNGQFYHGKTALRFMAQYGDNQGLFNWCNKALFWSSFLSTLLYPWMRATRNLLLRLRHKSKIDNLQLKSQPTFKSIFGDKWELLPPVMQKHYANHPYSNDKVIVEGLMDVEYFSLFRWLRPFYRFLGTVPIECEQNVSVTVNFDSTPDTREFQFNRQFHFRQHKPYRFCSRMLQVEGNQVVEMMRFGICWCMRYDWDDGRVKLQHQGYALKLLGHFIPLPLHWIMGRGDAEEIAVDDDQFDMQVTIVHPLFGQLYSYRGRFRVVQLP